MNRIVEIKKELSEYGKVINSLKKEYHKINKTDEEKDIIINDIIHNRTETQHLSDERKRIIRDILKANERRRLTRVSERIYGIEF